MRRRLFSLTAVALIAIALEGGTQPAIRAIGSATAPITMEVFSDYQCGHCKALYEQALVPLMNDYVRAGKVYLVHREFPLPQHPYAREAACLACAANRIGKYERVCDVLFRTQDSWSANGKVAETACSVLTADEAKKVLALAKDPSVIAEVQQDLALGRSLNINATPTVLLTHKGQRFPIPGGVSYPILRRFLDQLLVKG